MVRRSTWLLSRPGSRDLKPATDVFFWAACFMNALTGQPPFVADHIAAVLIRILFEDPIPIAERRPGISNPFQISMGRMLCKDPEQRLADAEALRAELSPWVSSRRGLWR